MPLEGNWKPHFRSNCSRICLLFSTGPLCSLPVPPRGVIQHHCWSVWGWRFQWLSTASTELFIRQPVFSDLKSRGPVMHGVLPAAPQLQQFTHFVDIRGKQGTFQVEGGESYSQPGLAGSVAWPLCRRHAPSTAHGKVVWNSVPCWLTAFCSKFKDMLRY